VTLTRNFYIGVFEVTQEPSGKHHGQLSSSVTFTIERDTRAAEGMIVHRYPGSDKRFARRQLALTGYTVSSGQFHGQSRNLTALTRSIFDGRRSGTARAAERPPSSMTATAPPMFRTRTRAPINGLNVLGRYAWNGGKYWMAIRGKAQQRQFFGPTNGTAIVGSYLPNNWGLYDTLGNVWDLCLDWSAALQGGTIPREAQTEPGASRAEAVLSGTPPTAFRAHGQHPGQLPNSVTDSASFDACRSHLGIDRPQNAK
jgi:hypothetical protein